MVHARRDEHTLYKIVERVIDVLAICPDNIIIPKTIMTHFSILGYNGYYQTADLPRPTNVSIAVAGFRNTTRANRPS